ncbi:hypothetical protein AB1Y20_006507 [Prymnesium parvum]|uniref:Uncharacterized protein n=1 Tax=Prymnesium parvum TaxID=97485 RepID=A0AB34IYA5_PRYPA
MLAALLALAAFHPAARRPERALPLPSSRSAARLAEPDASQLGDDDYIPPQGPIDALIAREVAKAFDGEEERLLDADEEARRALIESRVADVTRSVLGKLGWGEEQMAQSLEGTMEAIAEEAQQGAVKEVDGAIGELRAGITDSRARIYDEIDTISSLRREAAELTARNNSSAFLLAAIALGLVAVVGVMAGQ